MKLSAIARAIYRSSGLKAARKGRQFAHDLATWRAHGAQAAAAAPGAEGEAPRVLVIPPDPLYVTHSRGDQAMLTVVLNRVRETLSVDAEIHILTSGDSAEEPARALGCRTLPLLVAPDAGRLLETIAAMRFTHGFLLGADVIDGKMDPVFSQRLIMALDAVHRSGGKAGVLGFSYARDRFARMGESFDQLSAPVPVHLRDPHSRARLAEDTQHGLVQVADLAFMLPAADVSGPAQPGWAEANWIAARKAEGKRVIGLNFNPMPFSGQREEHDRAATVLAAALARLAEQENLAFLLIPHDFRHENSDLYSLGFLAPRLGAAPVLQAADDLHAAQLKGICGLLDGVLTARMHLAIAALGAGTPVCVATYRNKFSGLLELFALSDRCMLEAGDFAEGDELERRLAAFLADLPALRDQVDQRLPGVMALSQGNFAWLEAQA